MYQFMDMNKVNLPYGHYRKYAVTIQWWWIELVGESEAVDPRFRNASLEERSSTTLNVSHLATLRVQQHLQEFRSVDLA